MPRNFRHNARQSRDLEPERCELCGDAVAEHVVRQWTKYGLQLQASVCDWCLPALVQRLRAREAEYRVSGLPEQL